MSRARSLLPWLLGLALMGVLVAWFLLTHKRELQTIPLPARGEASYNPLYALKLGLHAQGQQVQSRQRLELDKMHLGAHDTVLIYSDPRTLGDAELAALFAFVETGGHLILRLPAWQQAANETTLSQWLPIAPNLHKPKCMAFNMPGQTPHQEFCNGAQFDLIKGTKTHAAWRTRQGQHVFARFAYGDGSVDVLSTLDMLNNTSLSDSPHSLMARQLLAPNWKTGRMHLVYAADMPPLWRWLLIHAWQVLLPLLLALLTWLWLRAQRFGPWLPSSVQPRRALLEHVDASGEHLLRYGKLTLLHRALRETVLARLRRVDPLIAAQQGDTQARLLAQRLDLHPDTLRAVLDTRPPATPHEFRQRIARLIALRKRL
ncbi:MAG TPA: DUF4350 domain-containing protein [Thermomonas sp.]|nr:DUF4350 domain-containing protein [Thermomonas sp.]